MKYTGIAAIALTAGLAGCNLHGRPTVERKARPIAPDRPAATEALDVDTVVSPGVVEPWDAQVELSAQESGWIARIVVKEGEVVQAGQLLATLDDTAQRHAVDLARADLSEAEVTRARIESGATAEEVQQAQADCDAAAARAEFSRAAAARMNRLHGDNAVSDEAVERATADAREQSALSARASARLAELKRGARIEDRQVAAARLLAAQARLRVAEDSLVRRRIAAPSAGTILLSRFHAGEFYSAGAGPLFVLGDMTRLQVRLEVDEIDAAVPIPGDICTIYSDAGVRLAAGTIVRLAPKMGRRALPLESPTARADVRVREVFVQLPSTSRLVPNQRVWGHTSRTAAREPGRLGGV